VRRLFRAYKGLCEEQGLEFIHGMAWKHRPAHGERWEDDADHWLRELEREIVEDDEPRDVPARNESSTSEVCDESVISEKPVEPTISEDWPWLELTRDARVVMVGGTRRPEAHRQLERELRCEIDWVEQSRGEGTRTLQSVGRRISNGTVDLVILLRQYVGHDTGDHIVAPAKQHDVPFAFVDRGYGIEQVHAAIERYTECPGEAPKRG
jgi:hypothetical protein